MASEQVLEVLLRRYVFDSDRPFASVLDGVFGGISQPDIGLLFSELAASISYEQFSSLVGQAQGSAGLIRFLQLDLDHALTLDPSHAVRCGSRPLTCTPTATRTRDLLLRRHFLNVALRSCGHGTLSACG